MNGLEVAKRATTPGPKTHKYVGEPETTRRQGGAVPADLVQTII